MYRKIVVGYDGSDEAEDALLLGWQLAAELGAEVVVAWVSAGQSDAEIDSAIGTALERMPLPLSRVWVRAVAAESVPAGLEEVAEREDADLIVTGATHHEGMLQATLDGVPGGLFEEARCAVAVAPRGYAARRPRPLRTIGAAFDGSLEAGAALDVAAALARAIGADLTAVSIAQRSPALVPVGSGLEAAIARHAPGIQVERVVLVGESPASTLVAEAARRLDLLVMGSRGHSPFWRALLGSVSTEVTRHASCPVLVVPHAAIEG